MRDQSKAAERQIPSRAPPNGRAIKADIVAAARNGGVATPVVLPNEGGVKAKSAKEAREDIDGRYQKLHRPADPSDAAERPVVVVGTVWKINDRATHHADPVLARLGF